MSKEERLAEFFRRLLAAPACDDAETALAVLSQTLTAVEDEFSGVPNDPSNYRSDGRLYPPQAEPSAACPVEPACDAFGASLTTPTSATTAQS